MLKKLLNNHLFYLSLLFCISFTACSVTYQTQNVNQPILLSDKVGVSGTILPKDSKSKGTVDGEIMLRKIFYGGGGSETAEKANADIDFMGCVQTNPNRYVTNLTFKVRNHQFILFTGGEVGIEYFGNCQELSTK
ncbi:MAG: hypothetical protein Q8K98_03685 [Bacteroidota bacterium]|nr:hypothetical protein [Bacteroidota bacterium]